MKRYLLAILVLMMVFGPVFAANESMISVSGNGQVSVDPDVAYITFAVIVLGPTAQKAQTNAAETMANIIDTITSLGIGKDKIETSSYNLNPELNYSSGKSPKITGYRCENQIKVTIENLGIIGGVIDAGTLAGANSVNSIIFGLKDDSQAKTMALEKAVQDAQNKAKAIAKAAGIELKGMKSIIEGGANVAPMEYPRAMMASNSETPIMSGKIKVYANVIVNYEK